MADHEQQPSDYSAQQDESAVALTTAGEPEPPIAVHSEPIERDHEAVDTEQGNLEQAAAFTGDDAQAASATQAATATVYDDQLPNVDATMNDEPITTTTMDLEQQPATEMTNDVPADIEMDNAQPVPAEPISVLPKFEDLISEQQVMDPAPAETVPPATEEPVAGQDEIVAEDNKEEPTDVPLTESADDANIVEAVDQKEPEAEAGEVDNGNAGEDSADDLFGSDDEAPKTRNGNTANDDSESEDISPEQAAARAEDEDEDDEDMPMRKKQRAGSPSASDAGGEHYERGVDADRNNRDLRQDEEDERKAEEPDENDEALARKRALDARIEAIGKAGKRKRSRKKDDSEDLGLDRHIEEMTTKMDSAIRDDIEANRNKRPAVHKTKILDQVIAVLQNASLQQSMLESNDFLSTLRRFIEPMEDGSLPSLTIQKGILFQLGRLDGMEVIHLRNSGLGKVVNFYTRCKRSQPEVIRQANLLIDRWSKPILDTGNNAKASMRARAEADREDEGHRRGDGGERGEGSDSDNGRQKDRKQQRTGELLRQRVLSRGADEAAPQKGTRLPNVIGHAYAVAPQARRSVKGPEEQALEEARQREMERINRFKKKAFQASR
ncbi:hypothetical protein QFC20_000924 [Naganishia adeliensis]|uniref:Uncharacterized protein n=1 Tax=Naganishia adeliensis TaxID=92952 RepID=A0ACC2WUY9_9TREE|nr:hypothetical protein QFC20_000924 [Naganishia adeliensis]